MPVPIAHNPEYDDNPRYQQFRDVLWNNMSWTDWNELVLSEESIRDAFTELEQKGMLSERPSDSSSEK